jgi:hypothetical protein
MDSTTRYVARANIDHYLGILNNNDISSETKAMVTKLLITEEDKLGHDLEQLEFAENRAAKGRDRVNRLRLLRNSFVAGAAQIVKHSNVCWITFVIAYAKEPLRTAFEALDRRRRRSVPW